MTAKNKTAPRRGGRPSKQQAEGLEDKILDAAAALFFSEGYGVASIEEIVRNAQISKRTFYARFENKEAVFRAVVHRLIVRLRPQDKSTDQLFEGGSVVEVLRRIAPIMLRAALSPDAVALQCILMAEAKRFPELALIMHKEGARAEAIRRIADLLQTEANAKKKPLANPAFVAEQFLQMVTSAPLRRALGLGLPMTEIELDRWANETVDLFLNGCW